MNKITVAIPFYNTSQYFEWCTENALKSNFVGEILVVDDHSEDVHWNKLNELVKDIGSEKIKVYRNDKNLGGFKNKYKCIEKSTCDWIYLLDSDNKPCDNVYGLMENLDYSNPSILYHPSVSIFTELIDNKLFRNCRYDYEYPLIESEEVKDIIFKKKKNWQFFLNNGNFMFNKNKMLEAFRFLKSEEFDNENFYGNDTPYSVCSIAINYHWVLNGGGIKIVPGWEYIHGLRSDSYWNTHGNDDDVKYFYEKIINI